MQIAWVLDCRDPRQLMSFWATALGYEPHPFRPPYLALTDPAGRRPDFLLQQVPEPKQGKNRMHLDLRVQELDGPLRRLLDAGGRIVHGPFDDTGWITMVLADHEDNELCLLVPPDGPARAATGDSRTPGTDSAVGRPQTGASR